MNEISRMLRNWMQGRRDASRPAVLDAATPHDLGLGPNDLASIAAYPADVPDRMARMASVFGAPSTGPRIEGWRNREMIHACATCPFRAQCADQLYAGHPARAEDCGFCPNAGHYRELAQCEA